MPPASLAESGVPPAPGGGIRVRSTCKSQAEHRRSEADTDSQAEAGGNYNSRADRDLSPAGRGLSPAGHRMAAGIMIQWRPAATDAGGPGPAGVSPGFVSDSDPHGHGHGVTASDSMMGGRSRRRAYWQLRPGGRRPA